MNRTKTILLGMIAIASIHLQAAAVAGGAAKGGLEELSAQGGAKVVEVIDGANLRVQLATGALETVVLMGIDVPLPLSPPSQVQVMGMKLIDGYDDAMGRVRLKRVAQGAIALLKKELTGQGVQLQVPTQQGRDSQGRLRAFVFREPDGYCPNLELVAQGLAYVEPDGKHPYYDHLLVAYAHAYGLGANLWAKAGDDQIRFNP